MFKVLIIGADSTEDYSFFRKKCVHFLQYKVRNKEHIVIYTIGDTFIEEFTNFYGIDTQLFTCDWNRYKKDAIKMRNNAMLSDCDAVIIFDDGTKNTKIIYELAIKKKIPCRLVKK